jgi:hypothetical protein
MLNTELSANTDYNRKSTKQWHDNIIPSHIGLSIFSIAQEQKLSPSSQHVQTTILYNEISNLLRHIQHDITTVQKYTTNTYEKLIWNDRPIDLSSPKQF